MAEISSLSDLYIDELKDLWSANDQMVRALKKIAPQATNDKLKKMLETSQQGIQDHTNLLKALIANQDEEVAKEHCKGRKAWSTRQSSTPSTKPRKKARFSMPPTLPSTSA